jgi:hypothetical protein
MILGDFKMFFKKKKRFTVSEVTVNFNKSVSIIQGTCREKKSVKSMDVLVHIYAAYG